MNQLTTTTGFDDVTLMKLAREIAQDINEVETILKNYAITREEWAEIRERSFFNKILESEVIAWNSASNSQERLKMKAASMLEEYLPKLNSRLHEGELTAPKAEMVKLVARVAGVGLTGANIEGGGAEKISVTINLGGGDQLKFEKQIQPPMIEGGDG